MMTFSQYLKRYHDFPAGMSAEAFHRGHAEALVTYVDKVVIPRMTPDNTSIWGERRETSWTGPRRRRKGDRREVDRHTGDRREHTTGGGNACRRTNGERRSGQDRRCSTTTRPDRRTFGCRRRRGDRRVS